VTGQQGLGDAAVREALQSLGADLPQSDLGLRVFLYRALSRTLDGLPPPAPVGDSLLADQAILASRLGDLDPLCRRVLLLTSLEGFTLEEAAEILELSNEETTSLVNAARAELRVQRPSRILVIEDEPIIALDISQTLKKSGHTVVGIASTHDEALALAREDRPELILADIQLADNSSGLEAVLEILEEITVPVIFITAFPEQLLSGERPEPAFLITKPFDVETLNVSISQALSRTDARPN
jgi:CheY-like chemotaxis protein